MLELILVAVVAYVGGMVSGKVLEAWLWRETATDFSVRKSLGRRYSVRRVL